MNSESKLTFGSNYLNFLNKLEKIIFYFLSLLLGIMVLFGSMQVFWRYVLQSSLSWSEELMRYINIWTIFLGICLGVPRGLHTAIDAIYNVVNDKAKKVLKMIVLIISIIFSLSLLIIGARFAFANASQVSPTVRIPMVYVFGCIPIGGLLTLLYTVGEILKTNKEV